MRYCCRGCSDSTCSLLLLWLEASRRLPDRIGTMGGCHIREGEEAALRDPSHWTQVALIPVLPLLVAAVPLARFANPSEAFCGVETWVLPWPVLPILPLRAPGSVLHGLYSATKTMHRTTQRLHSRNCRLPPETAKAPCRKASRRARTCTTCFGRYRNAG